MAMIYSTSEHEASPGCCAYHDAQAKDAEIASLRAEVAKLRAERDEAKKSLDAACEALRMAGQAQHKYRIDRNAAEAEVARLRAEGEERERALREALREAIGIAEWMSGAGDFGRDGAAWFGWRKAQIDLERLSAALRPHKEEP